MISPDVFLLLALFEGADGVFPSVKVVQSIAVNQAAAGEPNKAGMKVGNDLSQIRTQTIFALLEGILREQGNLVKVKNPLSVDKKRKPAAGDGLVRLEGKRILFPIFG